MKLIGLAGRAGSGKDTVADYLVAHHRFVKRGFTDALYEEVAEAFGVTVEWLRDRTRKEIPQQDLALGNCRDIEFVMLVLPVPDEEGFQEPRSPRWILQQWGTEYRRGQDPDYWVRQVYDFCRANPDRDIAIPDVRFDNEASMVRSLGGAILVVSRPQVEAVLQHESEKGISHMFNDYMVYNGGVIRELHDRIDGLLPYIVPEVADATDR
jgi:hypothetical protein